MTNLQKPKTADEVAALPADTRLDYEWFGAHCPVNLRVLHEFDVGRIEPQRLNAWAEMEPTYVNP